MADIATVKAAEEPEQAHSSGSENFSNDPSFTNLHLPYWVICRQRYNRDGIKQRRQFIKEIQRQEILQSRALDGVRIHRMFINPILENIQPSEVITLTPRQQFKLEELLRE